MTGRQIHEAIIAIDFAVKAMEFSARKQLDFTTKTDALDFLTFYCVLLSTKEHTEYDENSLLVVYNNVRKILEEKKKISSNQFLSNPPENVYYILRGSICLMLK